MAAPVTNKPRPLVVRHEADGKGGASFLRLLPAAAGSALFHALLFLLLFFLSPSSDAQPAPTEKAGDDPDVVKSSAPDKPPEANDPFVTTDVDPSRQDFDTDIQFKNERMAEFSVPGLPDPSAAVGIVNGDKDAKPTNLPAPAGLGSIGQGGASEGPNPGNLAAVGQIGGYGTKGMPLAGSFYGRSGATRQYALRSGGGTGESEAAVTRGLRWLVNNQSADGHWSLDGQNNDIAGTAFGLLPLLGAGHTHQQKKGNIYDKPIHRALSYLMRKQNKRTGDLGGGMYAHGLATIAMCEAYGLSQDPHLRAPAQMAVNYIVYAQHKAGGGWRYAPGQPGDTSVAGWQIMALKSAQMAGLDVPDDTMRKAQYFIDSVCDARNEGYGYTGPGSTPTMSAVGLLCRQYLQSWGPKNDRMIKGVSNHLINLENYQLKKHPQRAKDIYYYYYATQVMHHFGGKAWEEWNKVMREALIFSQEKVGPLAGSWSALGEGHAQAGGRLMVTSLSLLSLEVYYRHLPLYYRDPGEKMAGN